MIIMLFHFISSHSDFSHYLLCFLCVSEDIDKSTLSLSVLRIFLSSHSEWVYLVESETSPFSIKNYFLLSSNVARRRHEKIVGNFFFCIFDRHSTINFQLIFFHYFIFLNPLLILWTIFSQQKKFLILLMRFKIFLFLFFLYVQNRSTRERGALHQIQSVLSEI